MNDRLPTDHQLAILRELMQITDWDAAGRYVAAHPELLDPAIVLMLVNTAAHARDDTEAHGHLAYAARLCGVNQSDALALVLNLATVTLALEAPRLDDALFENGIHAARRVAQAATTPGLDPVLAAYAFDTAAGFLGRAYAASGHRDLLDDAVAAHRAAARVVPDDDPDRPRYLNNLARGLVNAYRAARSRPLLQEAVRLQRQAVRVTPASSPNRFLYLNNLASHLGELYEPGGDTGVLYEAVDTQRQAVRVTPSDSPYRPVHLSNLAGHLVALHQIAPDTALLTEAVDLDREAARTIPEGDAHLPTVLSNLATNLDALYRATGEIDLLHEAVRTQRRAVSITPATSLDLASRLHSLGGQLAALYRASDDPDLIDEAVQARREAVRATPADSYRRARHLDGLATCLVAWYNAVGDRHLLDEAVQVQREAVRATPADRPELAGLLNNLAGLLATLRLATGDRELLTEAIQLQRRAVRVTPSTSVERPRHLSNLAVYLGSLYRADGDQSLIEEAVRVQSEVVAAVPAMHIDRPMYLNNLADHLTALHGATGDRQLLERAVTGLRDTVRDSPPTDARLPLYAANLADRLADLFELTGDRRLFDEATGVVAGTVARALSQRATLAITRARLFRLDEHRHDRYQRAAAELSAALAAFRERDRGGLSLQQRRDLAHQADGVLGELVANHVLAGDAGRAVELIEGDRIWLQAPGQPGYGPPEPPVAVAWVAAGRRETVVVTAADHRDLRTLTPQLLDHTYATIGGAVTAALNAARLPLGGTSESRRRGIPGRREAVAALCDLTGEIAAAFPPAKRLLVIPLGICALLPFTAASRPEGGFLIDDTTITVAPSLAWARAAHRTRPAGRSVGAFHPGPHGTQPLDLRDDIQTFASLVNGEVLDQPTGEQVLTRLSADTPIGHFSCHGAYHDLVPLDSRLHLDTDLTIRAVLHHAASPWLVNLSACETAVPDLQATEQHISFPTGFLLGGASHVIATLWPVGNTRATAINRTLYQQLAADQHPVDALRHALQHLRSTSKGPPPTPRKPFPAPEQPAPLPADHPFWWAPFTHYGSPW